MLVLSRKKQQSILIGENIRITIIEVKGNRIRVGIEAPPNVNIVRSEVLEQRKTGERSLQANETR